MLPIQTALYISRFSSLIDGPSMLPVVPLPRTTPISAQVLAQYLTELSVYLLQNLWTNHKISVPVVSLRTFIVKLLTGSKTTASTLQLALIFLLRLRTKLTMQSTYQNNPYCSSSSNQTNVLDNQFSQIQSTQYLQCGRRMFLVSLILAYKVLQDKSYSSKAWSKISGLSSAEITCIEREVLEKIDWDLTVSRDTFTCWTSFLSYHVPVEVPVCNNQRQLFQAIKPNPNGHRQMDMHGLLSPDNQLNV